MRVRIEELSAQTGVSTRNIRAYQQRGLLPPPELEGRTGYYGEEHKVRLRLIEQLQEQGFSLAAIEHTLDAWSRGGQLSDLLGLHNVLLAPFTDDEPEVAQAEELLERFPDARRDPSLIARAVELELIAAGDRDGQFVVPSPLLLQAGEVLVRAGVPLGRLLDLVADIRADVDTIARRFVRLVADEVVLPAADERADERTREQALRTVQQLRPIALEVVRPFLARALEHSIEAEVRDAGLRLVAEERALEDG